MSFVDIDVGSTKSLVWILFGLGVLVLIWFMATWGAVILGAAILALGLAVLYYAIVRFDAWASGGLG